MGEMADFALEQVETAENRRFAYRQGEVSTTEAYEEGIIDEQGFETSAIANRATVVTCRCCGESGLSWKKIHGIWRLFLGMGLHKCPANPLRS
jgi:hypothetical protein